MPLRYLFSLCSSDCKGPDLEFDFSIKTYVVIPHQGPRLLNFFHNSTEHEIFPTVVGILTFMSGKNSILGLSEPKKAKFLDISILMCI